METSALVATVDQFIKSEQDLQGILLLLSIFNSNETIRKCRKSKILQDMHLKSFYYSKYIAIVDMRILWRLSTPSSADREKGDDTVYGNIMGTKFSK